MRLIPILSWAALCISTYNLPLRAEIELFVDAGGSDTATGTIDSPLATISEAQRRLRLLRLADDYEPQAIRVHIAPGHYELSEPLELSEIDSGTETHPVRYVGSISEPTVISGACQLDTTRLTFVPNDPTLQHLPAKIRENIRCIDLREHGIKSLSRLQRRLRHENLLPAGSELFINGQRQQLAGWPNSGWAQIQQVEPNQKQWTIEQVKLTSPATDAWVHGFLAADWQDDFERVALTTNHDRSTTIEFGSSQAPQLRSGARFRLVNILSELDSPNEYYLDRDALKLYIHASELERVSSMCLTNLETPVSLYDVQHVTLSNLTLEGARVCGIEIAGGRNITVENCTIRNVGNIGVNLFHGYQHRIDNCHIYNTGAGAIRVEAGDRRTLFSGEIEIHGCRLHDFAQLQMSYRPAINVYGVGTTIDGNRISHGPHAAIILHGNDHLVQSNQIHHVCTETDDVGAIYLAHDPTFRGNRIRNNFIHDLGGFSRLGVIGVYLDDFASGTEVMENIFVRAGRGVAIGGGRDNSVENNLFIECLAAVQIDCRGRTWAQDYFEGSHSHYSQYFAAVSADTGHYVERYPALKTTLDNEPHLAKGNRIERNLFDGGLGIDLHDNLDARMVQVENNFSEARQLLSVTDSGELRLREGTAASQSGFRSLSLNSLALPAEAVNLVKVPESTTAID